MKKLVLLLGIIVFLIASCEEDAVKGAAEVDGVVYQDFAAALENISSDSEVVLLSDIELSDPWIPLFEGTRDGSSYTVETEPFTGVFDGNGHTISGLNIVYNEDNEDYAAGFFGVIDGAVIKDVIFADSVVTGNKSSTVGTAVGLAVGNSRIENVKVIGNSSVSGAEGGGIVGRMILEGTITGCVNEADVTTTAGGAGGIVGKAYYSEEGKTIVISDCENHGTIVTEGGYTGGIGGLVAGEVSKCRNYGDVTGKGTCIGGIIGEMDNYGFITGCENQGKITNSNEISGTYYGLGGIAGWIRYQDNASSYGRSEAIEVTGNFNYGEITGEYSVGAGGIVGMLYNTGKVNGNTNNGALIKGTRFVSGIVGAQQVDENNLFSDADSVSATEVCDNTCSDDTVIEGDSCASTILKVIPAPAQLST